MKRSLRTVFRRFLHQCARSALALLPKEARHALYRSFVDCDPAPGPALELKIADTQDELEACFALLHDAYVASGFMQPDASGLRVTAYHALPTTTTLCAKIHGRVVGTLSLVREGVFGFPMQSAFDLSAVRAKQGRIAEVSALAIHPDYRATGGRILFPLMKFMYEYCTAYFDVRHLVIAVNPNKIELYESLLFFERLQAAPVARYDFANGAPAVGATLDLAAARERFKAVYGGRPERRNLHRYFVENRLANIRLPARRYHTTNDPVMTEALIEHFFMRRTSAFAALDARKQLLLRSLYELDALTGAAVPASTEGSAALRRHPRYSINCPARLERTASEGGGTFRLKVIELSLSGFQAECPAPMAPGATGRLTIELGTGLRSVVQATAVRRVAGPHGTALGFRIDTPDAAWAACVHALQTGSTHADLQPAPAEAAQRGLAESFVCAC
ncbi:N-acyl amino acid synthase FeeM domain-containing protein [Aquabacterium humicola]|uniref:N-acyl amino acid synthase FeeM domain-containing protein n=1 Tax=Aquabacterium humicola TaxID=3237377 RepID=UPI002542F497|nr:PilZ domain-containing protein [Rubrivivax pictus]